MALARSTQAKVMLAKTTDFLIMLPSSVARVRGNHTASAQNPIYCARCSGQETLYARAGDLLYFRDDAMYLRLATYIATSTDRLSKRCH
jgi:hypothetical protein